MSYTVPVGISNKHLHLSKEHLAVLFGEGHELIVKNMLSQPGQFAAEEKVDIVGPKNTLKGVRVLGPCRKQTQIELALTDARQIGLAVPVRESGKLEGSAPIKLIGPCGELELEEGAIAALRHIHLSAAQAEEAGVTDKQIVSVKVCGERGLIFNEVLIRCGDGHEREMHVDTDEANAAGLKNGVEVEIIK